MLEHQETPSVNISHKRKLAWAHEIIQEAKRYGAPEGSSRQSKNSKPFSSYVDLMCDVVDKEPAYFETTVKTKNG